MKTLASEMIKGYVSKLMVDLWARGHSENGLNIFAIKSELVSNEETHTLLLHIFITTACMFIFSVYTLFESSLSSILGAYVIVMIIVLAIMLFLLMYYYDFCKYNPKIFLQNCDELKEHCLKDCHLIEKEGDLIDKSSNLLVDLAVNILQLENDHGRDHFTVEKESLNFKKVHAILQKFNLANDQWGEYFKLAEKAALS